MSADQQSMKRSPTLPMHSRSSISASAYDIGAKNTATTLPSKSEVKPGSVQDVNDADSQGFVMLDYPVSVNRYWRNFKGRMVVSTEAVKYKQHIRMDYAHGGGRYFYGVPVSVEFRLHPKTTKTGAASKTRMDLDNCIKVLLDALNGVAYMDDKQVVRLVGEISYPVDGGGLSVRVTA